MKVYVCFGNCAYDGYGRPEHVFTEEEDAKKWVSEEEFWRDYVELEVE